MKYTSFHFQPMTWMITGMPGPPRQIYAFFVWAAPTPLIYVLGVGMVEKVDHLHDHTRLEAKMCAASTNTHTSDKAMGAPLSPALAGSVTLEDSVRP